MLYLIQFYRNVCANVSQRFPGCPKGETNVKQVSVRDIARQAGVSTSTVSHVLNKTRYVSPEITERLNHIIEETGYRQNMLARAMRRGTTNTIGIIIPKIDPGYFYGLALRQIEGLTRENGYRLLIRTSGDDPAQEQESIRQLLEWKVDGIILVPSNNDYDYSQIPCPVVLMDREPHIKTVSGFYVDNYEITCRAMQLLIGAGHGHIAFMGAVPRFAPTVNRVKGYRDMLRAAGIPLREAYIRCGPTTQEEGTRVMRTLLEETDVTAALIASSPLTVGAMNYINAHGIPVPERMAIVSFGNYEWMPLCNPPLDGIMQPNREIGMRAAQRMLEMLSDPQDRRVITENLKCTYIAGRSVSKAP